MTTQHAGFTVLSTPVALCDRRALSQAWYSALHLHKCGDATSGHGRKTAVQGRAQRGSHLQTPASGNPKAQLAVAQWGGSALALTGAPAIERRMLRSKLAQKIERVFTAAKTPPKHASFSLEGARGRVQILLQQHGSYTQIIALCPPAARDIVAQALVQARYALSLRGIAIQSDVRGFARS